MLTIEQVWWILLFFNVLLTAYLVYRHWNLRTWYNAREEELWEDYKRVENHALDEAEKYMKSRKEYDDKIKNSADTHPK